LADHLQHFRRHGKVASFLCVRPNLSYHVVSLDAKEDLVSGIHAINNGEMRINGGYFIFQKKIFDYLGAKEELVLEPFQRLIEKKQLIGYGYNGFWAGMDTFKDKEQLEDLWGSGTAPWHVWKDNGVGPEDAKLPAPVPVVEFVDRRSSVGNGITGPRKVGRT